MHYNINVTIILVTGTAVFKYYFMFFYPLNLSIVVSILLVFCVYIMYFLLVGGFNETKKFKYIKFRKKCKGRIE